MAAPSTRPAARPARQYLWRWAPLAVVAAVVGWDLWELRVAVAPVAYLNDASVHEQMVRDATRLIGAGRLPFTSWFPYIGLGSAQFLHYQSLGSVLTGLAGTVVGANTAFRWSLYLLLSLWPLAVYASARLFGLPRAAAAAAAVIRLLSLATQGSVSSTAPTSGSVGRRFGRSCSGRGPCRSPGPPRGGP